MYTKKLIGLALIGVVLFSANSAFAKTISDSTTNTDISPVLTAGPCDLYNPNNEVSTQTARGYEWDTAIVNPNFPGGALVHIVTTPTEIYASSICLEDGWTIKYKVSGAFGNRSGFDARFLYNDTSAVDIRYVFGWFQAKYY